MARSADAKLRLRATDKMSRVVNKVSKTFPKLTKSIRRASIESKKFNRDWERVNRGLKKTGRGMMSAGKTATLGLTAPIVALGAMTVRTGIMFEKGMNKVEAVTKFTTKSMGDLRKQARDLGRDTQFSATEAAEAMAFLGQANFDSQKIFESMPHILNLAAASTTELGMTADIASNIMGAFGLEGKEMGRVADVLAATTASSNVNLEMMGETMSKAAPIAKKYGLSIEETSAAIGLMGNIGLQGSVAGTQLNNMMLKMTAPASLAKKLLGELGVKAVDPTTKKMRNLNSIFADLGKAFKDKNIGEAKKLAILNELFGKRAIAGGAELLDQITKIGTDGKNSYERLTEALEKSNGTAKRMREIMEKDLGGAFTKLNSAFTELQLSILNTEFGGKKLKDRIVDIVKSLTEWLGELTTTNKTMLKWGVILAGVTAVLGPMLVIFGALIAIIPSIVTGWGLLTIAWGKFTLAVGLSNVALLPYIALLAALATAGLLIWKNWEPIKGFFADLFTDPIQQLKDMVDWAMKLVGLSTLFGVDSDFIDGKLESRGFKIQQPGGKATSAKNALDTSKENKARETRARLAIDFTGDRQGTRIIADDREGLIEAMTGAI